MPPAPRPRGSGASDAARLLWANPAGADVFGAASPAAIAGSTIDPKASAALQIARLAGSLPQGGAPRLERLRGFGGRLGAPLTCACSRIILADGTPAILVAAATAGPAFASQTGPAACSTGSRRRVAPVHLRGHAAGANRPRPRHARRRGIAVGARRRALAQWLAPAMPTAHTDAGALQSTASATAARRSPGFAMRHPEHRARPVQARIIRVPRRIAGRRRAELQVSAPADARLEADAPPHAKPKLLFPSRKPSRKPKTLHLRPRRPAAPESPTPRRRRRLDSPQPAQPERRPPSRCASSGRSTPSRFTLTSDAFVEAIGPTHRKPARPPLARDRADARARS